MAKKFDIPLGKALAPVEDVEWKEDCRNCYFCNPSNLDCYKEARNIPCSQWDRSDGKHVQFKLIDLPQGKAPDDWRPKDD
ncbi:MAG: hypothetical protein FWE09_00235 [Treponema sp.]|nr:hypothetical protein [Treponema sp.]